MSVWRGFRAEIYDGDNNDSRHVEGHGNSNPFPNHDSRCYLSQSLMQVPLESTKGKRKGEI